MGAWLFLELKCTDATHPALLAACRIHLAVVLLVTHALLLCSTSALSNRCRVVLGLQMGRLEVFRWLAPLFAALCMGASYVVSFRSHIL